MRSRLERLNDLKADENFWTAMKSGNLSEGVDRITPLIFDAETNPNGLILEGDYFTATRIHAKRLYEAVNFAIDNLNEIFAVAQSRVDGKPNQDFRNGLNLPLREFGKAVEKLTSDLEIEPPKTVSEQFIANKATIAKLKSEVAALDKTKVSISSQGPREKITSLLRTRMHNDS